MDFNVFNMIQQHHEQTFEECEITIKQETKILRIFTLAINKDDHTDIYANIIKSYTNILEKYKTCNTSFYESNIKNLHEINKYEILEKSYTKIAQSTHGLRDEYNDLLQKYNRDEINIKYNDLIKKYEEFKQHCDDINIKSVIMKNTYDDINIKDNDLIKQHKIEVNKSDKLKEYFYQKYIVMKNTHDDLIKQNKVAVNKYDELKEYCDNFYKKHIVIKNTHDDINIKYNDLIKQHKVVVNKYDELKAYCDNFYKKHIVIKNTHDDINIKYDELTNNRDMLINSYDDLKKNKFCTNQ